MSPTSVSPNAPATQRPVRSAGPVMLSIVALVALVALVSGLGWWVWSRGPIGSLAVRERCTASSAGATVELAPVQAENAATIAAVAGVRGLPARAVTIALAAAYQESGLYNLDHGDRDSLGLFQQRPSQGWGTAEQVQDPAYAAGRFFDKLAEVPAYETLPVTVAAQRVQRSAYPDAYADHESDARVVASALTGNSRGAFSCVIRTHTVAVQPPGADGLTARAETVRTAMTTAFGTLPLGGFATGGVSTGHMKGSAHYDGRAIDAMFTPMDDAHRLRGWALAHWLVAYADRLEVATVIYDDRIWTAARSSEGWRPYTPPGGPTDNATLRHLDHVHVDVAGGTSGG